MTPPCPWCAPGSCPVGYGRCHCGCGEATNVIEAEVAHKRDRDGWTNPYRDKVGWPYRYRLHHSRPPTPVVVCPYCGPDCAVGLGRCHCGCGRRPAASSRAHTMASSGVRVPKGAPLMFVPGHRSQFSDEEVRILRRRFRDDESLTYGDLAAELGCSRTTIYKIMNFRTYREAGI